MEIAPQERLARPARAPPSTARKGARGRAAGCAVQARSLPQMEFQLTAGRATSTAGTPWSVALSDDKRPANGREKGCVVGPLGEAPRLGPAQQKPDNPAPGPEGQRARRRPGPRTPACPLGVCVTTVRP